jgi:hypothetical protein
MTDRPARNTDDMHDRVASALADLEAEDPSLAEAARAAWTWLAGDAPPDAPLQRQLQDFLWYALPLKWTSDVDHQLVVVAALARLFDLLGAQRYAQLCRAPESEAILRAYDDDPGAGFRRYRRALDRSGIDPPDVPELAWGGIMSVEEALARDHVGARLEQAVSGGHIVPGANGWRTAQRTRTSAALAELVPDHPGGQTWLQTVVTARLSAWIERYGSSPGRWRLVRRLEAALLHPVPVPAGAAAIVAPLRWLLGRADDGGLTLTARGNLARPLVREVCARFGWEPLRPGAAIRRQDDIAELVVWDGLMRAARLVRRRGRHLVATPAGRNATADVDGAWRALAAGVGAHDGWVGFLRETALLLLLDAGDDGLSGDQMHASAADLAAEAGWRDPDDGQAPAAEVISRHISPFVFQLCLLGLAAREHDRWSGVTRLRHVGRATAIEALRGRGNAPRDRLPG